MPFDGSGNFNRVMRWQNDAAAAVKIKADRHDQEDDNIASGLTNTLTKDGQSQPTANIPLNGKRIINLGNPINPQDAATKAYVDLDTVHAAPDKAVPVDADEFAISNSASTPTAWQRAKVTYANLKTALNAGWGAFIHASANKATLVDADEFGVADSASTPTAFTNARHTWAQLKLMIGIGPDQRLVEVMTAGTTADLDTYSKSGWFYTAVGALNVPIAGQGGFLQVYQLSTTLTRQVWYASSSGRLFTRFKHPSVASGAWQAWTEITVNGLLKAGENTITAGGYLQSDLPADAPVGGAYRPSPFGGASGVGNHASPGNARSLALSGIGAFTFNAPTTAGNYSLVITMQSGATPPTPTFAGFTKITGSFNAAASKATLAYITKVGSIVVLVLEPMP